MAVITPAIGIQSGSHSAKAFRQLLAALAGADVETFVNGVSKVDVGHGLVRSSHYAVTQNGTPNMTVNVAKGIALVNGSSSLAQGIYAVTNDATVNLAIATANATNPRKDLIVVQVRDNTEDAGGANDARLFVVTGTPAASPVDPAIPAGALVLARVDVPALDTSITNSQITKLAGIARGSAWNQSWGTVASAIVTSTQPSITGEVDATGLSVTWTADPARQYRITFQAFPFSTVDATDWIMVRITDGSNNVQGTFTLDRLSNVYEKRLDGSMLVSGLSGAITRKLRVLRLTGTGSLSLLASATLPTYLLVEDIGPL